jgi:hypothetical protein
VDNYIKKLLGVYQSGKLSPGNYDVVVLHDQWCDVGNGGECNCDPDVIIKWGNKARKSN